MNNTDMMMQIIFVRLDMTGADYLYQAYDAGHAIPGSRTASQLDKALAHLSGLIPFGLGEQWSGPSWKSPGNSREFLMSEARVEAIRLGARLLLYADYCVLSPDLTSQAGLFAGLGEFRRGLTEGGMGRHLSKSLISREVSVRIEQLFTTGDDDSLREAQTLLAAAKENKMLASIDQTDMRFTQIAHYIRRLSTDLRVRRRDKSRNDSKGATAG